jgi:hypothetical protein
MRKLGSDRKVLLQLLSWGQAVYKLYYLSKCINVYANGFHVTMSPYNEFETAAATTFENALLFL